MQLIKNFIEINSSLLFKHLPLETKTAIFDDKGFIFTDKTKNIYDSIKNEPHLYIAYSKSTMESIYVGKSFQNGGRWKRQHAYHMGTLAYHLLEKIRYDDQNHLHWLQNWMNLDTKKMVAENSYSIELKDEIYISFIPFKLYSNTDFKTLDKQEIRKINTYTESSLIQSYLNENKKLLNVQHNKKPAHNSGLSQLGF